MPGLGFGFLRRPTDYIHVVEAWHVSRWVLTETMKKIQGASFSPLHSVMQVLENFDYFCCIPSTDKAISIAFGNI